MVRPWAFLVCSLVLPRTVRRGDYAHRTAGREMISEERSVYPAG